MKKIVLIAALLGSVFSMGAFAQAGLTNAEEAKCRLQLRDIFIAQEKGQSTFEQELIYNQECPSASAE